MKIYKYIIILLWLAFMVVLILILTKSPLIKNPDMIFTTFMFNCWNTGLYLMEKLKEKEYE